MGERCSQCILLVISTMSNMHDTYIKLSSSTAHTDIHNAVHEHRYAQRCSEVTVLCHKCTPMSPHSADERNLNVTPSTTRLLAGTAPTGSSDI
jgi:hypothetical protein